MAILTAERLRSILHYDPVTGVFTWAVTRTNSQKAGTRAGNLRKDGYRCISIDRRLWLEHRLAVLYMTGALPSGEIDHVDLVKDNNAWVNLRPCSLSQNRANTRLRSDNKTGLKGVHWHKDARAWVAKSRGRYLGKFDCPAAAHFSYIVASDKSFGKFARFA
jgi:hypothetical protein